LLFRLTSTYPNFPELLPSCLAFPLEPVDYSEPWCLHEMQLLLVDLSVPVDSSDRTLVDFLTCVFLVEILL
jgi:hypothetical protein